ncbi:MAG: bifunctional pyr operon transcriptional regulator/uracil phosphoribosyltransferase PyrR [Desulfovibrio sp.]|nr:bifunctional pyr operon transcriptional regulator/uracil phosphoribosyltransferase PyrR [Desulfovibrio sp.]
MFQECILDHTSMALVLDRLGSQLLEVLDKEEECVLIGIERRGADLARRLGRLLAEKGKKNFEQGTLDINLYRDDWTSIKEQPVIGTSCIPTDITDKTVVLIDDVLFSGRTVRAALDALLDYGRPKTVKLLVLIDRGHRELPIQADFIGKSVKTRHDEQIMVSLEERDGVDQVLLTRP